LNVSKDRVIPVWNKLPASDEYNQTLLNVFSKGTPGQPLLLDGSSLVFAGFFFNLKMVEKIYIDVLTVS